MARKAEVCVDRAANVLSSKFNFVTSDLACGVMLLFRRLVLSLQHSAHASVRRSRKCVLPLLVHSFFFPVFTRRFIVTNLETPSRAVVRFITSGHGRAVD